jgi:hypothetical protein
MAARIGNKIILELIMIQLEQGGRNVGSAVVARSRSRLSGLQGFGQPPVPRR